MSSEPSVTMLKKNQQHVQALAQDKKIGSDGLRPQNNSNRSRANASVDTVTESFTWFTASTESIDRKGTSDYAQPFSPNVPFIHLRFQYPTDSKSLDLDKSYLTTLLMLLHLLSITIMSKLHGGIEMKINMDYIMIAVAACLPL